MSAAWVAYRLAAGVLGKLAPLAGAFRPGEERSYFAERLGRFRGAGGFDAWIHAASLGEATGVGPLAQALRGRRPGARLLLTATTTSGRARLAALGHTVALAPLDVPGGVARFFAGARPARLLIVETELWPHWLLHARAAGVPVAVLSARLSARSLPGYRRLGSGFRGLVRDLEAVLCQSPEDCERWLALGARPGRTAVAGNLKNDALPSPSRDRAAARQALGLDPERPLLVLGSVRPGEVRLLARGWQALPTALRRAWQVAAVPRHAAASAELAAEARAAGQPVASRGIPAEGAWRWENRTGVLLDYYAAAEVAFVGGTLKPYGGHNPLEPAAAGAAVLLGSYFSSQADAVRALRERHGAWIASSPRELLLALGGLLGDGAARAAQVAAALEVVAEQRGAAARSVDRLAELGLWPA